MKRIFTSSDLWNGFTALTSAARGYVPPQRLSPEPSEPETAVEPPRHHDMLRNRSLTPLDREILQLMKDAIGVPQLMEAAVRFTILAAIDVAKRDQVKSHALEGELISKLATWGTTEDVLMSRLWTHDMSCVLGELECAALRYSHPSAADKMKHVLETFPRNLAVAAVAFTVQLAIEESDIVAAAEMRTLEGVLIAELETPWEFGKFPLSVDVEDGKSWGTPPKEED